jgi:hypothetical protein
MKTLPLGVWYEEPRDRYRVRLYKNREVTHLSYHKTQSEAESTLKNIKNEAANTMTPLERLIIQTRVFYKQRRRPRH